MNLRQLRYFVAIAQTGSFNAAADLLHIAQSALSRHMKDLEEELGGPLLERGTRGVSLSESGKTLFDRARFILSQMEETRDELLAHNKELLGTIRLMTPSSVGQILFEPLVNHFLKQFPKVRLELSEGLWNEASTQLQSGAIDVAIVGSIRTSEYIEVEPLASEQMIMIGRAEDPLLARKSISVTALAGLPLILPATTVDVLRRFAPEVSDKLKVSVFVESSSAVRTLAASGWGYAIVPRSVLQGRIESRKIAGVPIRDLWIQRQIGTLRGRPKSRVLREMTAALRREFTSFIGAGLMRPPLVQH